MIYYHADVFSAKPLSGNGLTVIFHENGLDAGFMQQVACEFKQFETIFLQRTDEARFRTHIFTVEEELDFAGHPILGAMAVIHERFFQSSKNAQVVFALNSRDISAGSEKADGHYVAEMQQGAPDFLGEVEGGTRDEFVHALGLSVNDLYPGLPVEVVSTGLPYLIVPLASGLERAKICVDDLEARLSRVGAKFVYIINIDEAEGRTWDNLGAVEDIATGSAAGPAAAYLYKHGLRERGERIEINQGRFVGRPSKMEVTESGGGLTVRGGVRIIAEGRLLL